MRRSFAPLAAGAAVAAGSLMAACDVCAGTASCHTAPQLAVSGRVVEHATGAVVPGAKLAFYWRTGVSLDDDSAVAVADADGAFRLNTTIREGGSVRGRLVVTPPPPHAPYTVHDFEAPTHVVRGDGIHIGDVVVDPFLHFIAEVHDRYTGAIVPYADVQVHRTGGAAATPASFGYTADGGGRIHQEIRTDGVGTLHLLATVTDYRYPRPYQIRIHAVPKYLETPGRDVKVLAIGSGLPYWMDVRRRGSGAFVPGVTLKYRRVGGIDAEPDSFTVSIPSSGVVATFFKAKGDGILLAEFIVEPPPPFRAETSLVALPTQDTDSVTFVRFGFGSQVFARARFRYRATGQPVEGGVHASLTRQSGTALDADGVLVPLDSTGTLTYTSSTADTGVTTVNLSVNLRAPFDYDTLRGFAIPARRDSSVTDLGTLNVGRWLPWSGSVVDALTDAPIAGATVTFTRSRGIPVAPSPYQTVSDTNGSFPIRPVPLRGGEVVGDLAISFGGTFRDTVLAGVRLTTTKDDTLRAIPVIRAQRLVP